MLLSIIASIVFIIIAIAKTALFDDMRQSDEPTRDELMAVTVDSKILNGIRQGKLMVRLNDVAVQIYRETRKSIKAFKRSIMNRIQELIASMVEVLTKTNSLHFERLNEMPALSQHVVVETTCIRC